MASIAVQVRQIIPPKPLRHLPLHVVWQRSQHASNQPEKEIRSVLNCIIPYPVTYVAVTNELHGGMHDFLCTLYMDHPKAIMNVKMSETSIKLMIIN